MKKNIFITQKSKIQRVSNTIKVVFEESFKIIPLSLIANLYLFGKVDISYGARNFLLQNDIDIYLLSRSGALNGILTNSKLKSNYKFRLSQYQAYGDKRLELSKFIVKQKIITIEEYIGKSLQRYKEKLKLCESIDEILGVEGSATIFMFKKLKSDLAKKEIMFTTRSYHPPKDYINSLLSFAYKLYYSYLYSTILSYGLDPYIGFLHQKRGKHAPLVSDILEIKRVELTQFVVNILLDEVLNRDDFDDRFHLKSEKIKIFIKRFIEDFIENEKDRDMTNRFIIALIGEF